MLLRACVRCAVSPSACSSPHVLVCMLVCACMRASMPHSDSSCISSTSPWRGASVCGVSWTRQTRSVLARRSSFCRASASAVKRARCRSNLWWGARGAIVHGLEQHIQCMCAWKVGRDQCIAARLAGMVRRRSDLSGRMGVGSAMAMPISTMGIHRDERTSLRCGWHRQRLWPFVRRVGRILW